MKALRIHMPQPAAQPMNLPQERSQASIGPGESPTLKLGGPSLAGVLRFVIGCAGTAAAAGQAATDVSDVSGIRWLAGGALQLCATNVGIGDGHRDLDAALAALEGAEAMADVMPDEPWVIKFEGGFTAEQTASGVEARERATRADRTTRAQVLASTLQSRRVGITADHIQWYTNAFMHESANFTFVNFWDTQGADVAELVASTERSLIILGTAHWLDRIIGKNLGARPYLGGFSYNPRTGSKRNVYDYPPNIPTAVPPQTPASQRATYDLYPKLPGTILFIPKSYFGSGQLLAAYKPAPNSGTRDEPGQYTADHLVNEFAKFFNEKQHPVMEVPFAGHYRSVAVLPPECAPYMQEFQTAIPGSVLYWAGPKESNSDENNSAAAALSGDSRGEL